MKLAVLGLGSAGRRHAANLLALGHDVVGFDPAAGAPPPGVEVAASEDEAIETGEAVIVASPNAFHADQAIKALTRGRPVLVEKPLAVEDADGERVAEVAARAGLACAVGMNLRFHPGVLGLRGLLAAGALGERRLAHAWFGYDLRRWRPETDYRQTYSAAADLGGGIVLDAIHEFDYLLWLFGAVESVVGETAKVSDLEIDVEDTALAVLSFAAGPFATLSLDYHSPVYRRGCVIEGTDAVARWSWPDEEIDVRSAAGPRRRIAVAANVHDTYVELVTDFLRAIEVGTAPRCTVDDGLAVLRIATALKRSAAEGRRIRLSTGSASTTPS